jgi:hypothetical protein
MPEKKKSSLERYNIIGRLHNLFNSQYATLTKQTITSYTRKKITKKQELK